MLAFSYVQEIPPVSLCPCFFGCCILAIFAQNQFKSDFYVEKVPKITKITIFHIYSWEKWLLKKFMGAKVATIYRYATISRALA